MTVAVCHATAINKSVKSSDVRPFSKDCSKMIAVPIFDVEISYDFPYSGITYILIIKNALYIPSMNHNLVPPFIMREAGLIVNDVPRIHTRQEDLTNQTHFIVSMVDGDDNGTNLNIRLKLDGIVSYFPARKITMDELKECEYMETVYLSLDASQWNPYDEEYAESEDKFLDFRGDLIHRQPRCRKILDDSDLFELQVSEEYYEAAISSIVVSNYTGAFKYDEAELRD